MASNVKSLNKVILVGNVQPRDPEVSRIPSLDNKAVAKFTLVTKEGYMDRNNQWQEQSEWHNVVAWGYAAQKVEKSVSRGTLLMIEGKIKTRKWQDNNGQNRYSTEIQADTVVVLDNRKDGAGQSAQYGNNNYQQNSYQQNNVQDAQQNNQAPVYPEVQIDGDDGFEGDPF